MSAFAFICDEALDRLGDKLHPVIELISDPAQKPIGIGFTGENTPVLRFRSQNGITTFQSIIDTLDTGHPLYNLLVTRRPVLEIHPRFENSTLN